MLGLRLQGKSVDGQEAIEGSSIDQLYDEIWEENTHSSVHHS